MLLPKTSILFFLFISLICKAQNSPKIYFEFDAAGNQITRYAVLSATKNSQEQSKSIDEVLETEFKKSIKNDIISFYPNPVKEELYVRWDKINDTYNVKNIQLFDINGKELFSSNKYEENKISIPFLNYPNGLYQIVLQFENNDIKTIKVIKE